VNEAGETNSYIRPPRFLESALYPKKKPQRRDARIRETKHSKKQARPETNPSSAKKKKAKKQKDKKQKDSETA